MEDRIEIFADTHEPGSLEMMLGFLDHNSPSGNAYSTGDHIPSGMKGPDRELCDKLRKEKGITDVQPALVKAYEEDPEFRRASDEHYQKTIANMAMRRQALKRWMNKSPIYSCPGNQDYAVSKKMSERYGAGDVFEAAIGTMLVFIQDVSLFREGNIGVLLVPYTPSLKKYTFEEAKEKLAEKRFKERDGSSLKGVKRFLLLSHQSIDCTAMGLPEKKRDTYTDPGNRALITHYYEFARNIVGPENVQMVHGHHHTPYVQYEFRGSKVHNLDIGDLLLVDETGETEVKHVMQRF